MKVTKMKSRFKLGHIYVGKKKNGQVIKVKILSIFFYQKRQKAVRICRIYENENGFDNNSWVKIIDECNGKERIWFYKKDPIFWSDKEA